MLDVGVCGLATAVEVCTFRLAMRTRRDQELLGIEEKSNVHNEASALLCTIPDRARDIDGAVSSSRKPSEVNLPDRNPGRTREAILKGLLIRRQER